MKKRKLLVLDIDGTLTNTQKDITPKTLEAILKIEQMGHAVALASGRPTGGMRRYIGELELAKHGNYAISYNGACVTNMQTNEIVYKNVLPDYVAPWMLDYAREHDYKRHQNSPACKRVLLRKFRLPHAVEEELAVPEQTAQSAQKHVDNPPARARRLGVGKAFVFKGKEQTPREIRGKAADERDYEDCAVFEKLRLRWVYRGKSLRLFGNRLARVH